VRGFLEDIRRYCPQKSRFCLFYRTIALRLLHSFTMCELCPAIVRFAICLFGIFITAPTPLTEGFARLETQLEAAKRTVASDSIRAHTIGRDLLKTVMAASAALDN
jgi:hypothetical protein